MWILREGPEPELNDEQLGLLLSIYNCADSSQAWDITVGTQHLIDLRNQLFKMMYISVSETNIQITTNGVYTLIHYGLIQEGSREPTPKGKQIILMFQNNQQEQKLSETMNYFKNLKW